MSNDPLILIKLICYWTMGWSILQIKEELREMLMPGAKLLKHVLPPFRFIVRIKFSREFRNVVRISSRERFWTKLPSHRIASDPASHPTASLHPLSLSLISFLSLLFPTSLLASILTGIPPPDLPTDPHTPSSSPPPATFPLPLSSIFSASGQEPSNRSRPRGVVEAAVFMAGGVEGEVRRKVLALLKEAKAAIQQIELLLGQTPKVDGPDDQRFRKRQWEFEETEKEEEEEVPGEGCGGDWLDALSKEDLLEYVNGFDVRDTNQGSLVT
ncbi:hypothetical protein VPH35_000069 [Triticum aestivum]